MNLIRNFSIISHIDHGKSTLADRLLELTNTVSPEKMRPQYLDRMDLERERGVTIKMAPVRMEWKDIILNLIDTPGHIDFSYEVARSLKAVEGALLLVDASKGIQAQTLFNLELAKNEGLKIIPIINKIDLPYAAIENTEKELEKLGFKKEEVLKISAKTGQNVGEVLEAIVKRIPAPQINTETSPKALIFDSLYDPFKGVIAFVRLFDGKIKKGDKIKFLSSEAEGEVLELGYFKPEFQPADHICAGEIGYIKTGIKEIEKVRVGDTITLISSPVAPLPGYQKLSPMVYASIYPTEGENFQKLKVALLKLKLNDASLFFEPETSKAFGAGFKCGFLGLFHLEIIKERLEREFDLDLVITSPSVDIKKLDSGYLEPYARLEIVTPNNYFGKVAELANRHRAELKETHYLEERSILIYDAPLSEIISNFYDNLKNISKGYASMSYQFTEYKKADLVELDILIAKEKVEALSKIIPREKAEIIAKNTVEKLKEKIPRHLFEITIQAAIGNRIIASERISPLRKDVTGYLYGGDVTRKRKLLERQAKGKKRMKKLGKVTLPADIFIDISR